MKKGILINVLIFFTLIAASCVVGQNHVADSNTAIPDNRQQMLQSTDSADQNHAADHSITTTAIEQQTPNSTVYCAKNVNYEIIKQTYTEGKVGINYPQVTKLSDSKKQEVINEIIKKDALEMTKGWSDLNMISMKIDYEISWQSAELLSIKYSGVRYGIGAAHPTNEFYTTNINMDDGSKLKLKDLVNIDEDFVEKVKQGRLIVVSPKVTLESFSYTNAKFIRAFNNADEGTSHLVNIQHTYSYFTGDALGISVEISHPYGDHGEIEVPYQDIADNIKTENKIWKSILKGK